MLIHDLLLEVYGRVDEHVHDIVDGLDLDALLTPPEPDANPIGWLVWHLTRVQDLHVAEILEREQVWETGSWAASFGLDPDPTNHGWGHTPAQVAAVRPVRPEVLVEYHDAVAARTRAFLATVGEADLDRIVDERWDPPVTLGVRLVSIADDDLQHAGQAAYVKGLLERRAAVRP